MAQERKERAHNLKIAFDIFDENGDGTLSKDEVANVFKNCNVTYEEEDLQKLMDKMDENGDGGVTYEEFCQFMSDIVHDAAKRAAQGRAEKIRTMFEGIDTDGDKKISRDELKTAVEEMVGEELDEETMCDLMCFDKDGDGYIDFNEFSIMHTAMDL